MTERGNDDNYSLEFATNSCLAKVSTKVRTLVDERATVKFPGTVLGMIAVGGSAEVPIARDRPYRKLSVPLAELRPNLRQPLEALGAGKVVSGAVEITVFDAHYEADTYQYVPPSCGIQLPLDPDSGLVDAFYHIAPVQFNSEGRSVTIEGAMTGSRSVEMQQPAAVENFDLKAGKFGRLLGSNDIMAEECQALGAVVTAAAEYMSD